MLTYQVLQNTPFAFHAFADQVLLEIPEPAIEDLEPNLIADIAMPSAQRLIQARDAWVTAGHILTRSASPGEEKKTPKPTSLLGVSARLYAAKKALLTNPLELATKKALAKEEKNTDVDGLKLPLRGTQESLGPREDKTLTQFEKIWQAKVGKPVVTHYNNIGKGTHETIHLTPNGQYAISYSSMGITRIFDARTEKLMAIIPYGGKMEKNQEGVLMVSNSYFALSRKQGCPNVGLKTVLFDMTGKEIAVYDNENCDITGSFIPRDESQWIVTNQSQISVYNLPEGTKRQSSLVNKALDAAKQDIMEEEKGDYEIRCAALTPDGKTLFLAFHSDCSRTQNHIVIIALDTRRLETNTFLGHKKLYGTTIYAVDPRPSEKKVYIAFATVKRTGSISVIETRTPAFSFSDFGINPS